MKIARAYPPNFKQILSAFPEAKCQGVIFCYGDTCYNPTGPSLTRALIAHEEIHSVHQVQMGPAIWWNRYCHDKQFRFDEEFPAHVAEFRAFRGNRGTSRAGHLHQIAERLSGPLYGGLVSYAEASQRILEAA
jgi:hypothetical protein